jgi:hypothetical protein
MQIDKELSIYVDGTGISTVFTSYVDLFIIKKTAKENSAKINLSLQDAIELRDFLNYCYPKP